MTQPQLNKTNRKINLNTVITGLLVPIGLGIFWKCVQIYNLMLLQPGVDAAQSLRIDQVQIAVVRLVNIGEQQQSKNNEQDLQITEIKGILPKRKPWQ